ncbi:hypothetical protein HC776_02860, partial [bacterium]|nr:hypothetical protein [bacterium]
SGLLLVQITQTTRLTEGVWLGAAALLVTGMQAVLAVWVLRLAVRRAERTE